MQRTIALHLKNKEIYNHLILRNFKDLKSIFCKFVNKTNFMAQYQLGRDFDKPFKIEDKHTSVSHNHATITVDGDNWTLTDNDSTNGTYIEDDGVFRRCKHIHITPDTWIRLGHEGYKGYTFKARRVLNPNDYSEDFSDIYDTFQELEETKARLDIQKKIVRKIGPCLSVIFFGLSFAIPGINHSPIWSRLLIMAPGAIAPFISDALINGLEKKVKKLQSLLICPNCRMALTSHDIKNRSHSICKAG